MYGAMASFLMKHYVPVALHPAEWPELVCSVVVVLQRDLTANMTTIQTE